MTQDITDLIVKAREVLSGTQNTFGETADETTAVQRALEAIFGAEAFASKINTWADVVKAGKHKVVEVALNYDGEAKNEAECMPIAEVKSAQAYLILRQLIDVGYGGNPTIKEKMVKTYQLLYNETTGWYVVPAYESIDPIAFRTEEDAERFISFPENITLLDNYYMVK